jgi:hypothetical protein
MPGSALGFVAGTCVLLLLPQLPSAAVLTGIAVTAVVVALRTGSLVPLAFAAGAILCRVEAGARLADQLDPGLEGRTLTIAGRVVSVPQSLAHGLRFRFEPARALNLRLPAPSNSPGTSPTGGRCQESGSRSRSNCADHAASRIRAAATTWRGCCARVSAPRAMSEARSPMAAPDSTC